MEKKTIDNFCGYVDISTELNDSELCIFAKASRDQYDTEIRDYNSIEGVNGYIKTGCYRCDGINIACNRYYVINKK